MVPFPLRRPTAGRRPPRLERTQRSASAHLFAMIIIMPLVVLRCRRLLQATTALAVLWLEEGALVGVTAPTRQRSAPAAARASSPLTRPLLPFLPLAPRRRIHRSVITTASASTLFCFPTTAPLITTTGGPLGLGSPSGAHHPTPTPMLLNPLNSNSNSIFSSCIRWEVAAAAATVNIFSAHTWQ